MWPFRKQYKQPPSAQSNIDVLRDRLRVISLRISVLKAMHQRLASENLKYRFDPTLSLHIEVVSNQVLAELLSLSVESDCITDTLSLASKTEA